MKVKIKKGSAKVFQKRWQVKIFLTENFWSAFVGTFVMEIKVCKSGEMVRDVIECNSSGDVVINYICVCMIN